MATQPALPKTGFRFTPKLSLALVASILAVAPIHAQTRYYTASHPLRLQGFATFVYGKPGYAETTGDAGTDYGVTGGADLDVALHTWVIPGVDVRVSRISGSVTSESVVSGGPRVILPLGRIQPYGDFLLGAGTIHFNKSNDPNYTSNTSSVYSYGGGVDIPLTPGWGIRIDGQREQWRLTKYQPPFYAMQVSVGVRYEIHGGKHSPQ